MSSSRERLRLHDIVDEISAIEGYVDGMDLARFASDRRTIDATERCLERVIEATMKIGEERIAVIAPQLSFHELRGLGNRLRHSYETIETGRIFAIVRDDLPPFKSACLAALAAP